MSEQKVHHQRRLSIQSDCKQIVLTLNYETHLKTDSFKREVKDKRVSGLMQLVKSKENPISRVSMTIFLCMMMFCTRWALPSCF